MDRFFRVAPGGGRWVGLGIFLTGLLVGALLARVLTHSPFGDLLTTLSVLVIGLGAGAALFYVGWIAAGGRTRVVPGSVAEPLRDLQVASRSEAATSALAPEVTSLAPTQVPPQEQSHDAPAQALVLPVDVPQPVQGGVVLTEAPSLPPPTRTVERPPISIGGHIQLMKANGRWALRAKDVFGYQSLQFAVGLKRGWFPRIASPSGRIAVAQGLSHSLLRTETLVWILFVASLTVYAITRLFALDQFPINFFADEAILVMNAVDLVNRGFRDPQGGLFPMYFNVGFFVNPDIAVYFHVITSTLFGKSIDVARGTSAFMTIIAAGSVGLLLRSVFRARFWWAVVLLLGVTPTWFLFSRTAFDTVMMASLYALFIVSYLFYRYRSPRYIYLALILAAATFYAYPSGQLAIGLLVLFLLISDFRYHLSQARYLLWALPLIVVLAIPFVRFELLHPDEATYHLRSVNSYWTQDIPLADKLGRTGVTYLQLLSPGYWFSPASQDLIRHEMKDYGFLPLVELPLLLCGVVLCLRHSNESMYRAALAALLFAPIGAALADVGILRALAFVIPASIVSAIGLEWLAGRIKANRAFLAASFAIFVVLAVMSIAMLQDALANGPTWYSDYTLYGMQWGAKQVFQDTVPQLVADNPDVPIYVSDTWANATDIFLRFFDLAGTQVQVKNVVAWIQEKLPLDPSDIFVMTPDEYNAARTSQKFKTVEVEDTIKYPDGRDGFLITHLEYVDNVDAVFAAESAALREPVTDALTIDGEVVQLAHTKFDIGNAQSMFDGDTFTVARGVESNPLVLDFHFPNPRALHGLSLYLGKANVKVTARLYSSDAAQPVEYVAAFDDSSISTGLPAGPALQMNFDRGPDSVSRLYMEILYLNDDENAHVHVFELKFR